RRASVLVALVSASCSRSFRRSARARSRVTSVPVARPAASTTSSGSFRQGRPSSSTSTRPRGAARSAVIVGVRIASGLGRLDLFWSGFDLLACRHREQAGRGDALRAEVGLDPQEDLLGHVRVLAQERGGVLPALPEPLLVEA